MRHLPKHLIEETKRGLAHRMRTSWGLEPKTTCVLSASFADDRERFAAWLHDALYQAFECYEGGHLKWALRHTMQAREYLGRCGGACGPIAHDAATALELALEAEFLRAGEGK